MLDRFEAGYSVPAERRRHSSTNLTLPLTAWKTEQAEVLIGITTGTLTPLRPRLVSELQLHSEDMVSIAMHFSYLGSLAILLIIQAAILLRLRDPAARDYLLVSVCLLLLLFTQTSDFSVIWDGYIGTFHLAEARHHLRILHGIFSLMAFRSFFPFSTVVPSLDRTIRYGIAVVSVVLAASFFLPAAALQTVASAIQAFGAAFLVVACVVALRHRILGSALISIGWLPLLATAIYLNLARFRLVPDVPGEAYLPVISVVWEILFTTIGISYKIKQLAEVRHQKELRDLELAGLERMVRVLCHDLSTPLATIGMTTDLLQLNREAGRPVDLDATTGRLQHAVKSIKEIVDSTRQVEALKLNGSNLPREPVDLCTVFHDAERMVQEKLSRKRITLRRTDWPEHAVVLAEPRMLRLTIIANALSNAVKFSSSGGFIDVSLRREGDTMVLRIRDHGVGIPREMREAFARSGRIQSRPGTMNEEGTGFGMMLMRDFTKAMRGEFRLESRTAEESAADHGTTIEIRLPVAVTADHLTTP
jgi:signal transduction histidine kinase